MPTWPDLSFETTLWRAGFTYVAGLDEAGRGAWAGPVVAAGVILAPNGAGAADLLGQVNDSKQLSPTARERCAALVMRHAYAWAVGFSSERCIDALGIVPATRLAMGHALQRLPLSPDLLLIDHLLLPEAVTPQLARPKADALYLSVAAASILAKVARDRYMAAVGRLLPQYGFARHKGYGTASHRQCLERHGPCSYHRRSFAPVRQLLEESCERP
mgnify:FL=1